MDISEVPEYKRVSFTKCVVDFFFIEITNATHYFLSHFHSDHYYGINRSFTHPIYCSETTSNLLKLKYKSKTVPLIHKQVYTVDNDLSVCIYDANHCPGAAVFIFNINGKFVMHTGDFRCTITWTEQFQKFNFFSIFLDNTFEGYRVFPSQEDVIHRVINIIREHMSSNCVVPIKYQYFFCTYLIGKEKIFLAVAHYFNWSIKVTTEKLRVYKCYDQYTINLLNDEVIRIVENYKKKFGAIETPQASNNTNLKEKQCVLKTQIRRIQTIKSIKKTPSKNGNLLLFFRSKQINKLEVTPLSDVTNTFKDKVMKYLPLEKIDTSKKNVANGINYTETVNNVVHKTHVDEDHQNVRIMPFDRLSTTDKPNKIIVITTQHAEKNKLHKILEDYKCDKAVVFCGTGWSNNTVCFDWKRKNGRVLKKAIEIIHVPYSEHSSSAELDNFREKMTYEKIINTVKYKRRNDYDT